VCGFSRCVYVRVCGVVRVKGSLKDLIYKVASGMCVHVTVTECMCVGLVDVCMYVCVAWYV